MTSITTYSSDEETSSSTPDTTMLNSPETVKCGPKSWKEDKLDMGSDEELVHIFEGREGDIPEAFGRIDGVSTQAKNNNRENDEFDKQRFPPLRQKRQQHRRQHLAIPARVAAAEPIINIDAIIESNSIRIPNKGPDKRTISGLVRCVAEGHKGNNCGLCNKDYCQEQAGQRWYPLFGWEFCHQKCWLRLCENYHQHLEEYGSKNTTLNFIYFAPVPR